MAACKCSWGGCGRAATSQIVLKVWALATAPARRNNKNCLRMIMSVTICDDCKPNVKVENFLLPEGRARIAAGIEKAGGAMPDFGSAELDFEPIINKPLEIEQIVSDARRRGQSVFEA